MNRFLAATGAVLLGLALWSTTSTARADTEVCTELTTLPATIANPGHYCLRQDFTLNTAATPLITISVDDVVLDCNGHVLRRPVRNGLDSKAIDAPGGRRNVTIRNCVVDGFFTGIHFRASSAPGAFANHIVDNTLINGEYTGILVVGSNTHIERNRIDHLLGTGAAYGIMLASANASDDGNVVRDNAVTDLRGGSVTGIIFCCRNTVVAGNLVNGLHPTTGNFADGIAAAPFPGGSTINGSGAAVTGNTVLAGPALASPDDGARRFGIQLQGTGAYEDRAVCTGNVVGKFGTPITGCVQVDNTTF